MMIELSLRKEKALLRSRQVPEVPQEQESPEVGSLVASPTLELPDSTEVEPPL